MEVFEKAFSSEELTNPDEKTKKETEALLHKNMGKELIDFLAANQAQKYRVDISAVWNDIGKGENYYELYVVATPISSDNSKSFF